MTTETTPSQGSSNHRRDRLSAGTAVLWASAFVIAAMIIVQAGRLPGSAAHADVAIARGNYTLLMADSGRGTSDARNKLLYVIDSREQVLLVYEIEDARRNMLFLRDGGSIDNLFLAARR
jgi:hypothetical protein